jgi:phosphopantetheinyl transferase
VQFSTGREALHRFDIRLQNHAILASSLQTAFNLSILPGLVASLVTDLVEQIGLRIQRVFDMTSLAKELNSKGISTVFGHSGN